MRKVLIIGATSVIAQETAKCFAQEQAALFLVARHAQKLETVAADLRVRGASHVAFAVLDVCDFDQHAAMIDDAYTNLQGLDTVLIAHGVLSNQKVCEQSYAATEESLRVNFLSIVSFLTILANRFERQHYGCIAVISSVAGDRGRQSNYIYGTAKGALTVFLQGLRNRLHRENVCVLTVKPGFVETPMIAHLKKSFLWARPETVGYGIYRAICQRKDEVYLPGFWGIILTVVKHIPESVFKRLHF